jgi:stage IV sporulation protein FB
MRDPFAWSFAVGRMFGITIRIHVFFPVIAIGMVWRETQASIPGSWIDAAVVQAMLFFSVLLHEFGHCFMARWVGGEATDVLLWPLGGLASVDVPHAPRANFLTALGGPAVNLLLCVGAGLLLVFACDPAWRPPLYLNPFAWNPYASEPGKIALEAWDGSGAVSLDRFHFPVLCAQMFFVNWVLFLFNIILVGFPFDSGRMLQCLLWPFVGYRQATIYAVFAGFFVMFLVFFFALFKNEALFTFLAIYIYTACKQQWLLLEHGGEDSLFGYDFSQGYTSLEREPPVQPRTKQANFFQRWRQRRAARKLQREQQQQEEEENRMDQLLEKIQRYGKDSLTDEEHRFLKKVADRYRNRP